MLGFWIPRLVRPWSCRWGVNRADIGERAACRGSCGWVRERCARAITTMMRYDRLGRECAAARGRRDALGRKTVIAWYFR